MRIPLVVANWKMNLSSAQAAGNVQSLAGRLHEGPEVDVVVCPSYLNLGRVREIVRDTPIKLGAQDVFWKESGAYTGQVSAGMLYDAGAAYCIVGHSEKRGRFGKTDLSPEEIAYFGESDRTVQLKIQALQFHSITPILCVGETESERETGRTDAVIREQVARATEGLDPSELYFFAVAYEPVWAIGTGKSCDVAEAERVCGTIRRTLAELKDENSAEQTRILYGGSVKASNARELFAQPNIDGGLVGGASLDPEEFEQIVRAAV